LDGVCAGLKAGQGFSPQQRPLLSWLGDTRQAFAQLVLTVAFLKRLEFRWSGNKPASKAVQWRPQTGKMTRSKRSTGSHDDSD
jgi:hypothetical protein